MTSFYEIPLIPQNHRTTTTISGVDYILSLHWNHENETWIMDISSAANLPLVCGLALVEGVDLLEQHEYLGIGAGMIMDALPTYDSLGVTANLYLVQ